MKRTLIALLFMVASSAQAQKVQLKFVPVLEAKPTYVAVTCDPNICQGLPDLRQTGTTLIYECDGERFENWIPGRITAGMLVQVANCSNLVVNKKREPVVKQPGL